MKIEVTAEDIKNGKKLNCFWCPIALAVSRSANTPDCWVDNTRVEIRGMIYQLPREAGQFIVDFDKGARVEPFSFELEVLDAN